MRRLGLGGTLLVLFMFTAAATASAQAPVPCSGIGGGKYNCQWYPPGNGITGGSLVVRDRTTVGYLHQGTNWVICQQRGGTVDTLQGYRNHWFAWTEADNGATGWASAVEAQGGDDFGGFGGGVPNCNGAHPGLPTWSGRWGSPPPPPPPPTPPTSDVDRDGVLPPVDCNDRNASIRPGAHDVAGNGVDENCNGRDATARVRAVFANKWAVRGRRTRILRLAVRGAGSGATVQVSCGRRGRGCKVRRARRQVGASGTVSVKKMLRRSRLRSGAVIAIRVTAPNATGRYVRYEARRNRLPKVTLRCLPPGSTRPVRCG